MRLGYVMAAWRYDAHMSVREAAKMIGVSHNTLHRFENGHGVDAAFMAKVLTWLMSNRRIRRTRERSDG